MAQLVLPAEPNSSKTRCSSERMGQTHVWTPYHFIEPCSAYYAGSANNPRIYSRWQDMTGVYRIRDLEEHGGGGRGEVEALGQLFLGIVLGHVALDHHRLGSALLADQQHALDTPSNITHRSIVFARWRQCGLPIHTRLHGRVLLADQKHALRHTSMSISMSMSTSCYHTGSIKPHRSRHQHPSIVFERWGQCAPSSNTWLLGGTLHALNRPPDIRRINVT